MVKNFNTYEIFQNNLYLNFIIWILIQCETRVRIYYWTEAGGCKQVHCVGKHNVEESYRSARHDGV